jgi:hypothetical protein
VRHAGERHAFARQRAASATSGCFSAKEIPPAPGKQQVKINY